MVTVVVSIAMEEIVIALEEEEVEVVMVVTSEAMEEIVTVLEEEAVTAEVSEEVTVYLMSEVDTVMAVLGVTAIRTQ